MVVKFAVLLWITGLVLADKCPGLIPPSLMCCEGFGCYSQDPPFDQMPLPCCPDEGEVTYMLFTRENKIDVELITLNGTLPSQLSKSRQTVIVTHGWQNSYQTPWVLEMKDALLNQADYNVIVIDWSVQAGYYYYPTSASSVRTVGKLTSKILAKLSSEAHIKYSDMWCIGHSLGAHHCGHAAMKLGKKLGRITGLDPAGPWFECSEDVTVGLNKACADFVDIIHTDTKSSVDKYGTKRPIGHVDFYPNGIGSQPGCSDRKKRSPRDIQTYGGIGCSHGKAIDLFTKSISDAGCYKATFKCSDLNDIPESCMPCGNECAYMGYDAYQSEHGIYYLETSVAGDTEHCTDSTPV